MMSDKPDRTDPTDPSDEKNTMVWTIARKQLLNNLLTYKFLVGLVLCLVLFSLSAVVLTRDYEERLAGYNSAVSRHAASVRQAKVYSRIAVTVDRRPALLSPVCEGFEKRFATSADVSYTVIPTLSAGQAEKNPLMLTLKSIDLVAIIQIVLGLLALLFAYDSISESASGACLHSRCPTGFHAVPCFSANTWAAS